MESSETIATVKLEDGTSIPASDYLDRDRGDAPASRYGTHASDWQPVALVLYRILTEVHGAEPTTDTLDHVTSLVVNDHDNVAYTIVNDALSIGLDWRDYLDGERVQCDACGAFDLMAWEGDHCTNCHEPLRE